MQIRFYNTLTRKTEDFHPAVAGKATIYCCGPTVYDVPHAGHARCFVAFDVLQRMLRQRGFDVTYVRNITDIDDKILNRSRELGEDPLSLSRRMAKIFQSDMAQINCQPPDHEPRVSDNLDAIVELIEKLLAQDAAYVIDRDDGTHDVYFGVRGFEGYGKLSRRRLDDLISGARVEADETKRDPLDFALWKGCSAADWGWDSPWGRGRPGWHIECSAMCRRHLGHAFDIHAGGMDLIFPHHENEIAQSEAAHPGAGPFARIWMHNGFVNIDKEKMSKSLGNFVTVRDILVRNDAEALRWFLLTVHYRGPIQFDVDKREDGRIVFQGVDEAEKRVDYMYATLERVEQLLGGGEAAPGNLPKDLVLLADELEAATGRANAALADDLNTPIALAELGEIARHANELCDAVQKRKKDRALVDSARVVARQSLTVMRAVANQLGILETPIAEYRRRTSTLRLTLRGLTAHDVEQKVRQREEARKVKDFARADALRAELDGLRVSLRDNPDGTTVWVVET